MLINYLDDMEKLDDMEELDGKKKLIPLLILILLFFLLIVYGYITFGDENVSQEESLTKTHKCEMLKEDIEEQSFRSGYGEVEKIFYSPKKNSCLYVGKNESYITDINDVSYILVDYYTKEEMKRTSIISLDEDKALKESDFWLAVDKYTE